MWNKICVDLIGPYKIRRKWKEPIKSVTTIDLVTMWFEKTQYSDNKAMTITKLLETTGLVRYPWIGESMYDRGE